MIYGYCRCSTNESKQDVNRQVRELKEMGATDTTIYKEYVSGAKPTKIEFEKLKSVISDGDTIVVTEISRLSRSTKQLLEIVDWIKEKHLKLEIKGSFTIDCTKNKLDPSTEMCLTVLAAVSQFERDMIRERVKSGVANARSKGKRVGRPQITLAEIPEIVKKRYELFSNGTIGKSEYARMCGISRPTLDKYITIIKGV